MCSTYTGKLKTDSYVDWHRPQSTGDRQEDELMEKSLRALAHETDPLMKLRLLCLSKGASGIMGLCRTFRRFFDDNGVDYKRLTKKQFLNGIKGTGLELNHEDADEIFKKLDPKESGYISLDDFLEQIKPPMSESRRTIVSRAFAKLDKKGEGIITIRDVYSVACNPRYMSGEDTADLTMNRFLANFDRDGTVDGKVTLEEFMNYYSGVSVAIDNDCYFDLMIRQAYKL